MTRGQLKTRVARMLGLSLGTDDDSLADVSLLEELANEAVVDILSRTRVHVRRALVALEVGATEFDIDDVILQIHGVKRAGSSSDTFTLLGEQPRDTLASDGYAFVGYNRIVLGQAGAGEDLSLWYTPAPTPMTDDAHDPSLILYGRIPPEFHRAILNYMLWHAADKAGDQQAGRGERYRILYEGQNGQGSLGSDLGRIKSAVNTRGSASRIIRPRVQLRGDLTPNYWQG